MEMKVNSMRTPNADTHPHPVDGLRAVSGPAANAPVRPRSIADTGLTEPYLADLVCKHLFEGGVLDLRELTHRTALSGALLQELFTFLRADGRAEVRGTHPDTGMLCFGLTDRGRAGALEALGRDGYVGPAPVPLAQYARTVADQSLSAHTVDFDSIRTGFADTVIRPQLLDQIGPALHSGRAMFIYGAPGTGKSFIARRLARLLPGEALVPYAIMVSGKAIQCFDPGVHEPLVSTQQGSSLQLDQGDDPRYVRCRRPVVITGGELTLDMLEVQYDEATRVHRAPVQLRANNGLLVIDDLGRQRLEPLQLLNRWIVPLEERCDYLTLRNGQHFQVPFDVVLVFSTNRNPLELADQAFLRRIGYKIRFEHLEEPDYITIWRQECQHRGIEYDPALARFALDELHARHGVPLLPCHPRDLIDLAMDYSRYMMNRQTLSPDALRRAWETYFVGLDEPGGMAS
jgi:hypothetical protein